MKRNTIYLLAEIKNPIFVTPQDVVLTLVVGYAMSLCFSVPGPIFLSKILSTTFLINVLREADQLCSLVLR